jgi:hypothetical protein
MQSITQENFSQIAANIYSYFVDKLENKWYDSNYHKTAESVFSAVPTIKFYLFKKEEMQHQEKRRNLTELPT